MIGLKYFSWILIGHDSREYIIVTKQAHQSFIHITPLHLCRGELQWLNLSFWTEFCIAAL